MKKLINSIKIAFSMYSVIPMPNTDWKAENMRYVMCFFPLVGAVIGAAVYLWLWICSRLEISTALAAAVATLLPVVISGGIHLDGFCDTVDALASHAPPERKLEILKDPHVGSFAVMGCVLYLLLQFGLWCQYRFDRGSALAIAVGYVFSRTLSGFSVVSLRCAKTSGLAATFSDAAQKRNTRIVLLALVGVCAVVMLNLSFLVSAGILLAAVVTFWYYKWVAYQHFEGITGDLAGYFLQICELLILLAAVVLEGIIL